MTSPEPTVENPAPPSPTGEGTPTSGQAVLKPPDLVVRSASGEQTATLGPFFWVLESGFAGEVTAPGLVLPSETPLSVQAGETLTFQFQQDRASAHIKLALFPQEGNYEPIVPAPDAPKGFVQKTEPVVTAEPTLSDGQFSWLVSGVEPGNYFIRIEAEWPQHPKNPVSDKVPHAVYAFWVQIG